MEQKRESGAWKAFQEAFPYTVPIFAGFWFVAFSYGIYMHSMGFSFLYPALMAAFIFGGSLEFVVVTMLMSPFAPLGAFVMALMVQSRHLFYGISMLKKYENMGWKKPFLMFWMCDETFALNYTATVPRDVDRGWFMLWVSFLNYFYWVSGAAVGGLLGSLAAFDTKGLSFVMTALFYCYFSGTVFTGEKTLYRSDRRRVGSGVSGRFRRGIVYTFGHGSDPGGDYAFAEAD